MTEVVIKCQGNSTAKLGELNIIQGHLKELTDKNYSKLKNQILKNGFVAPFFTWSKVNGQPKAKDLLDGTQRKLTLLRMLDEKISMPEDFPIVEIDALDEKMAKKIIFALSSQYGTLSEESLFEFTHDILSFEELSDSFEFDAIDLKHFEKNFYDKPIGEIEGEDDVPEDAPTISKLGDIWHLGNHRIMNADCTVEENVKRLMGEEKADMVFTDPPYGVDYTGNSLERERLENDFDDEIFSKSIPILIKYVDGPCYTFFADRKPFGIYESIKEIGEIHSLLIWYKTNSGFTSINSNYKPKHESFLYWKPKNSTLRWQGDFKETTVWDIDKQSKNKLHPTQKPIELIERAIRNHKVESCFDPFLGSGSTLIACEKTNRRCLGLEIDPHYTDVVVKRFADFTHQSDNIYLERDGEKILYTQLLKQ